MGITQAFSFVQNTEPTHNGQSETSANIVRLENTEELSRHLYQQIIELIILKTSRATTDPDLHWLALTSLLALRTARCYEPPKTGTTEFRGPAYTILKQFFGIEDGPFAGIILAKNHKNLIAHIEQKGINELVKLGKFDPFHPLPTPGHYDLEIANDDWLPVILTEWVGTSCQAKLRPLDPEEKDRLWDKTKGLRTLPLKELRPPNFFRA